jgi:alkylhydroperoxidase family enzyme
MFERLREHFSNEQIVELTMRIALTGMFNTINQALDIELEEGMITMPLAEGLEETG